MINNTKSGITRYNLDQLPNELIDIIYSYIVKYEAVIIKKAFNEYKNGFLYILADDDDENIYTIKKYIYERYKLNYEEYDFYDSDTDDEEYNFLNEIELKIIKNYLSEWENYKYCEILTFVEFCDFYNEDYEVMRQNVFFQSKAIKKHFGF
jgi:hypothetical protein